MLPKRISKGKQTEAESSRPRKRTIRHPISHDIIFDNPKHERRYSSHVKRKITPMRYLCSDTLFQLGLSEELDRMFHVLGMLEFVHCETPTYERITLEFLSTIEFKLKKGWTVEQLGEILRLPLYGPRAVPDSFDAKTFWLAITKQADYMAKWAKASGIQNLCFSICSGLPGSSGESDSRGNFHRGHNHIAHHFGYDPAALNEMPFLSFIMALPDPARISIANTANWLYESVVQDDMDEHNADPFVAGDQQEEEVQEHEQFFTPPEDTTHTGVRSSYVTPDQWSWMQTEIGDLRAKQTCQGIEQTHQGTLIYKMHVMMQRMMFQFPPP
ncbi:hypothetical protein KIW84_042586 [Lathyrus oleraceus]|uniref:Arabidopsis retrotransposon Orf1 C-terminal domain-containing protein n=1 Tax=Pisum sativum TaxID=3888 RepID=A0A9D4XBD5_PEA|nr:hypothetical protein KIW84_042586 [Pisum sativum]